MRWFKKILGCDVSKQQYPEARKIVSEVNAEIDRIKRAGQVEGAYYTDCVERVKQLKREERYLEAIDLLMKLVDATEAESKVAGPGWGVAPWYYEQLAIIYRKQKRYSEEAAILERYGAQPKAPGVGPRKLAERLAKARALVARVTAKTDNSP